MLEIPNEGTQHNIESEKKLVVNTPVCSAANFVSAVAAAITTSILLSLFQKEIT